MDILASLQAQKSLNLFPTENRMSRRALAALSSDAVNRYPLAEGPGYFYGDVLGLEDVYARCVELASEYFSARHAFVPFLSGLHTMHSVLTAVCEPGAHVAIMDPTGGGHYATQAICEGFGYRVSHLPFDRDTCAIDERALGRMAGADAPDVVYLDASTILRVPDARMLRRLLPDSLICLDASHILGILPALGDAVSLTWLDSISGSTHKTLPGPQKGLLVTDRDDFAEKVAARLPFAVSSGHSGSVGALAITLEEMMPHRADYARAVVANARELAGELAARGFDVAGAEFGYTDTHQVWVQPPRDLPPTEWGRSMQRAGIRSTTVLLPSSGKPGLRLGVQELTRSGAQGADMARVADLLEQLLIRGRTPESVRPEVGAFASEFSGLAFGGEASLDAADIMRIGGR
jgi:glycine/serine hydroxymethyltransferase